MATENQQQLVNDIESAVSAIKLKNPSKLPDGLTITEICEMAGRSSVELRSVVMRLADNEEMDLVMRLHDAFMSVNLAPKYLTHAISRSSNVTPILKVQKTVQEAREMPRAISMDSHASVQTEQKSVVNGGNIFEVAPAPLQPRYPNPGDVIYQFISTLDPMPPALQHRIIASVSAYCGVGE